jgi:hypothetical protein
MHKTQFLGRLAADPKGQILANGSYVCNFRVLCENSGDERPIGFNVATWGTLGKACAKYLEKRPASVPRGRFALQPGKRQSAHLYS